MSPAWRDHDTERALLACCVASPDAMTRALAYVEADDFDDARNRKLFIALLRLHFDHVSIDALTLRAALREAGDLDDVPASYVADILATPGTTAAVAHYARAIHELALHRALDRAMNETLSSRAGFAQRVSDLHAAISRISQRQINEKPPFAEVLVDTAKRLEDTAGEAIATGFRDLDAALAGGPRRGHLVVLAALTSRGKSTLALNIATNVAKHGRAALVYSLEMSARDLARRLLFSEAQVPAIAAASGLTGSERERIHHAAASIAAVRLEVRDGGNLTPSRVRAVAQQYQREWGALDLIVIDYIGLMRSDERVERREREIASISRDLKLLAVEMNCVVLACAQLNRESQRREDPRPRLSDLRDSGAIEQDADTVIFIHQPTMNVSDPEVVELLIEKQRHGPLGVVKLRHRAEMTRFESLDER